MSIRVHNIHYAKTHFSDLLREVEGGEDVVIARAGTPVARLIPFVLLAKKRKGGQWKGKVQIASDFDEWPEDFLSYFS